MLLSYIHCHGPTSEAPELCLIPDKPDQFSGPVRIDSLISTECALLRLSPIETIRVFIDQNENAKIIEAISPAKLLLVPSQQDRPGFEVKKLKIIALGERRYRTLYMQDTRDASQWKEWLPNQLANV